LREFIKNWKNQEKTLGDVDKKAVKTQEIFDLMK
jgi:hypothetical protein